MKSFISAVCILFLMTLIITVNCVYINNVTNDLIQKTEAVNFGGEGIEDLSEFWAREKFYICLSTTHKETDEIEKIIEILKTKIDNRIYDDFEEYKKMLIVAIDDIKKDEEVSLNSIF